MLELRRLRLLRELHQRGTIAAVAEALGFTPSAVSQQLAVLERECGVQLFESAGRGVRLTDPALVLVEHADALLERGALAEADLAAASHALTGRRRIAAFMSAAQRVALPAIKELARAAPRLRCELIEAEPEDALPALALGDIDLVIADEWWHQPWRVPAGVKREELLHDPVQHTYYDSATAAETTRLRGAATTQAALAARSQRDLTAFETSPASQYPGVEEGASYPARVASVRARPGLGAGMVWPTVPPPRSSPSSPPRGVAVGRVRAVARPRVPSA